MVIMNMLISLLVGILACITAASQAPGLEFERRANELPVLKLDYGSFRATSYDANKDIYTFKNIRFGKPPLGNLRWAKPVRPDFNATVSDGSYGPMCYQAQPNSLNFVGPADELGAPVGAINGLLNGVLPIFVGGQEDCLFLDLFVPSSAINNPKGTSLPVTVWTYGGGYVFGAKDEFEQDFLPVYSGIGPVQQSNNGMIFISYNYRVGAFGYLAGTTMEKQGQPNVGFYDQRAVFQWVQDYIHLVGGNKADVTAWGESAGAGSLLHHITAFGGKQDPLFKKAVLQSCVTQALIDRRGDVENTFNQFASYAGCPKGDLACLRRTDTATLQDANKQLVKSPPVGAFAPGPAPDAAWVRQQPVLELVTGNFWKGIESLIVTHVSDEPTLFVPGRINTDAEWEALVNFIVPDYAQNSTMKKIVDFFPSPNNASSPYRTQTDRTKAWLGTSNFLCNYRYITSAFRGKTWNMQYSVPPGLHATDIVPTFFSQGFNYTLFQRNAFIPFIPGVFTAYLSYLTSLSLTGDPNTRSTKLNVPPAINWPHPTNIDGEKLGNVLNTDTLGFSLIDDSESLNSQCRFFLNVQAALTSQGGYSPPGGYVPNNLGVDNGGDPSRNYQTP